MRILLGLRLLARTFTLSLELGASSTFQWKVAEKDVSESWDSLWNAN
ncbi:hypothetical protein KSX25_04495 [Acinetobacter baumannii]|nr:hypothetical protein [Acinetobacter baumannii]